MIKRLLPWAAGLLWLPLHGSTILTCTCTGPLAEAYLMGSDLIAKAGTGANYTEQDGVNATLDFTDTLTVFGGTGQSTVTFVADWVDSSLGVGTFSSIMPSPTPFTFGQPFTISGAFSISTRCCDANMGSSWLTYHLYMETGVNYPLSPYQSISILNSDPHLIYTYRGEVVSTDPPAAPVPEPSFGLLTLGAVLLMWRFKM